MNCESESEIIDLPSVEIVFQSPARIVVNVAVPSNDLKDQDLPAGNDPYLYDSPEAYRYLANSW